MLDSMELRSTVLPNSPEMPDPHADGYQYDPESEGAEEPENLTTLPLIRPPLGRPGLLSLLPATFCASLVAC